MSMQNVVEDVKKAVADFRAENDKALAEVKKNGHATAETREMVDRLNAKVTDLLSQVDEVQKAAQRKATSGGQEDEDAKTKAEHRAAFQAFVRGKKNHGLDNIKAAMSVGDDTKGGYAVPETLDLAIGERVRSTSPMRGVCNVMTLGNEKYVKVVPRGEAEAGWVGEEEERPETGTPTLAELTPYFGELYAQPKTTQRVLDDAGFNVEQWLSSEVGYTFGSKEGDVFTMGNGVKKPKGILAYTLSTAVDDDRTFGALQKVLSGSAGAFVADKLIDIVHALHDDYHAGARWMVSNLSLAAIRKLKDGQGNYLWQAPDLSSGPAGTLLGYGITKNHQMPDPAADANALIFGNFERGYTIYDLPGARVIRDDITSKGFVKFYTTKRVGGMVTDFDALKVLTLSA